MNYSLLETPTLQANQCLVLGLFADEKLPHLAQQLDQQYNQLVTRLFTKLNDVGDFVWQTELDGHSLVVVHCGTKEAFNSKKLSQCLTALVPALNKQRIVSVTFCLPAICEHDANWQVQQMLLQIDNQLYQLVDFKTQNKKTTQLESIQLQLHGATKAAIEAGYAIAEGIRLTRHLADLPANICTPTFLADQAIALTQMHDNLTAHIMGPEDMRHLGMGALLAVAQGSQQEPRLIELHYHGGGDSPPVVLVGKGITFDSGGLSLKPANMMDEMKYDMCGAASILGTLKTCATLKLPLNLIGLIASAENLPSGSAVKPGDIVTSLSGQTIEILNTDAEGRLVLADALTYAERFKPQWVIDLATLTGAMVIALGAVATGFMTDDEELAQLIVQAGNLSKDKVWRMPLDDAYQQALDSPLADMINSSFDRSAAAITAACFLSRFTQKYRWAHLDIAGTAWIAGKNRVATGRPVSLLVQLLHHVANSR